MSKVKKIIICILTTFLVVFSGFNVFALSNNISFFSSQPYFDDNCGYIEVYVSNNGGGEICFYIWCARSVDTSVNMAVTMSGSELRILGSSYAYFVNKDGAGRSLGSNSSGYHYFDLKSWFGNDCYLYGLHTYGVQSAISFTNHSFTFVYGNDNNINNYLKSILSSLSSSVGSIDSIKENDNKNTQSIIDNQNQLAEQEKTETQNSGNDSLNDVSSSVPDKSAGMLSALQSLSNAVSYTGTTANWTFPQMYIPAISGVTDRINLNSEMEIDFAYWVNKIPQDIRTVISALATVGLVIFAFKELYGLISYVLTLKGGGSNE